MKIKQLLLTTSLIAALAAFPALAHEGEDHNHETAAKAVIFKAATAQDALAEVKASVKLLADDVEGAQFDAIHEDIEKTEGSIRAIQAKANLDGDKKARLEASLKQLSAQLGKLHAASDAKNADKTKAEFKKVEGALKLVENALK